MAESPQSFFCFHLSFLAVLHGLIVICGRFSFDFRQWWNRHDVDAPCQGVRDMKMESETISFEHTSMTVDADRHLRLVVYAQRIE